MPQARTADQQQKKLAELCPHMLAFISHCDSVGVRFGGCGECGSPWLMCDTCDKVVDEADEAFLKPTRP